MLPALARDLPRRGRARRDPAPWAAGRPGPPCPPGSRPARLSAYPRPPGRLGRRQRPLSDGRRVPAGRAGGCRVPPRSRVALSSSRSRNCRRCQMSKSAPDLEQALALTSKGRARRAVEPHEGRSPRVMIAIHVGPEVRDQLRAIALRAEGSAPRPGLRRAQRLLRPAPQARNRPLTAALQRALRPITAQSVNFPPPPALVHFVGLEARMVRTPS